MSDSTLNPRVTDDPRQRPPLGADDRGDPASAEDVDVALAGGIPRSTDDADPYGLPDDWPGHPQRKAYPLGGIDVEYKGAVIHPPDTRRSYN